MDLKTETNPLRGARRILGLSQKQAAERCLVSRSLFAAWERRERSITLVQLGQIERGLGLERSDIMAIYEWRTALDDSGQVTA